jgi:hypothetical protein
VRILICTKRDLPAALALNRLMAGLAGRGHELRLAYSDKTRSAELDHPGLRQLKLLERDLPNKLLFPLLESSGDTSGRLRTFTELERLHDAPGRILRSLSEPAAEGLLREFKPDLIVSIRFSFIFPQRQIVLPRLGILNIHPGTLPGYGGLFAPMRQMMQGETHAGATLHYIDAGIDTGPVIEVRRLPIDRTRSMLWHAMRLYPLGVDALLERLPLLEAGAMRLDSTPQPRGAHPYFTMPQPADLELFAAGGGRLYDCDEYLEDVAEAFGLPVEEARPLTAARFA